MKNICFTGHRNIKGNKELINRLYNLLEEMIKNGAVNFYAGGALGFDMLCEEVILELREKYKHIKLHLILPCPKDEQTENWKNETEKLTYEQIAAVADTVEICSDHYHKDCMKIRNSRLVELADCCICYYYKSRSGTGQTVRMAQKKEIEIINLYK